jgi:hypothetical protein
VELGHRDDRPRDRARAHQSFLFALSGIVRVAVDPVDADDGQQHMVPYPGPLLGVEEMTRGGGEVRDGVRRGARRPVGGVDDGVHAGQRLVEPGTGQQVHSE